MMYPLVRELAETGVPVSVSCRVLKLARQPYYLWLRSPVADAEMVRARRIDALVDAHREDPEFEYRFLHHQARRAGVRMSRRTAWALCHAAGISSEVQRLRRRGKGRRPGRRFSMTS